MREIIGWIVAQVTLLIADLQSVQNFANSIRPRSKVQVEMVAKDKKYLLGR